VLPYDQIPPERRTIADYTGRLGDEGHNGVLGVALAQWMARDDTRAEPEVRRAANTAMDAIDAMLAELYELRGPVSLRDQGQRRRQRRAGRRLAAGKQASGPP
jgi:hypothetical protein